MLDEWQTWGWMMLCSAGMDSSATSGKSLRNWAAVARGRPGARRRVVPVRRLTPRRHAEPCPSIRCSASFRSYSGCCRGVESLGGKGKRLKHAEPRPSIRCSTSFRSYSGCCRGVESLGGKCKRLKQAEPRPEPAEACPEPCRRGWAEGLYRSVRGHEVGRAGTK